MVRGVFAILLVSTAAARSTTPLAAKDAVLNLRGGAAPLVAAAPSRKATAVLGANALVSTAYGILSTCNPNAMLAIYGVTTTLDFMSPAYGVCQYLGGMYIAVAFRCLSALGAPGFPARDVKETLGDMCALHTVAGLVAGFVRIVAADTRLTECTTCLEP